ncbi:hypothetical protein D3C73_1446600 [compost metagenome]
MYTKKDDKEWNLIISDHFYLSREHTDDVPRTILKQQASMIIQPHSGPLTASLRGIKAHLAPQCN